MFQIIETLENVQSDRAILHVPANQVANEFTGRGIDILIARPLIHIFPKRIGQLDIEAAAQAGTPPAKPLYMLPKLTIDIKYCHKRKVDGRPDAKTAS